MKIALIILLCLSVAYGEDAKYTTKYDSVDIDKILNTQRLLKSYLDCLLDTPGVNCTPDGKELKAHINEALENGCAKCSEPQIKGIRKIVAHMVKNDPENWEKIKKKYDPNGTYTKKYEKQLEEIKA